MIRFRPVNRRSVGGDRVTAQFTMKLARVDPFKERNESFQGTLIFNVRGGCFFLKHGLTINAKKRLFKYGPVTKISDMRLMTGEKQIARFHNLEMKLIGQKTHEADCGIIVKFVNFSESQCEKLNSLVSELPAVHCDTVFFDGELAAA